MPEVFYALAVLACPIAMGVMMWLMMRGGQRHGHDQRPADATLAGKETELTRLQAEIDQLKAAQRTAEPKP